jgi:hypothetical protein
MAGGLSCFGVLLPAMSLSLSPKQAINPFLLLESPDLRPYINRFLFPTK